MGYQHIHIVFFCKNHYLTSHEKGLNLLDDEDTPCCGWDEIIRDAHDGKVCENRKISILKTLLWIEPNQCNCVKRIEYNDAWTSAILPRRKIFARLPSFEYRFRLDIPSAGWTQNKECSVGGRDPNREFLCRVECRVISSDWGIIICDDSKITRQYLSTMKIVSRGMYCILITKHTSIRLASEWLFGRFKKN